MLNKPVNMLFLNSLLFIGLIYNVTPTYSIPIEVIPSEGIIYPIHVACECDYNIYVDGKLVKSAGIVQNWDGSDGGVNITQIFNPVIYEPTPKIIAFSSNNNEYPYFMSGFLMDMNNGKDYTKHEEWKCKYFDPAKNEVVPSNWMTRDYNDIEWPISVSYGKNYQNNSFQIYDHERDGIHLEAEWLWTSVNSNPNIYCRKKRLDNEFYYVEAAPPTTSAPHIVPTSAHHIVPTSAPHIVPTSAHHIVPTSAPHIVPTSAPHIVPSSAPHIVQTSAPHIVPTSAPHIVPTSAPHIVQTSAPQIVPSSAPHIVQTSAPHIVPTSAPHIVPTSAPHIVLTSAPHVVPTSAAPLTTSAPLHEKVDVSQTIHISHTQPSHTQPSHTQPSHTQPPHTQPPHTQPPHTQPPHTHQPDTQPILHGTNTIHIPTPTSVSVTVTTPTPSKNNYNIIIHQHINFVIQNFKYTQKHSYAHIENLLRNLKSITQNHDLYKNLIYTRHHLYNHYNTIFNELYRLLKEFETNNHAPRDDNIDPFYPNDNNDAYDYDNDDYDDDYNSEYHNSEYHNSDDYNGDDGYDGSNESHKIPPFINSMKILDNHIQQLEKSIHFIKGKYKYTLLNILHKLKLQYRHDTIRLLHYWRNRFI
jgi:hypothetical protein